MKTRTKVIMGALTGLGVVTAVVAMVTPAVDFFRRRDWYEDEYEDDFEEDLDGDGNEADEIERTLEIAEEAKKVGSVTKMKESEADTLVEELNASVEQTEGLRDELHGDMSKEEYKKHLESSKSLLERQRQAIDKKLNKLNLEISQL